jgi:hypothetical protein
LVLEHPPDQGDGLEEPPHHVVPPPKGIISPPQSISRSREVTQASVHLSEREEKADLIRTTE